MKKICVNCQKEYERKNAREYCPECSKLIKIALSRKRNHEYDLRRGKQLKREKHQQRRAIAREESANNEITEYDSTQGHGIVVVVPFTRDFSKNKIMVANGRIIRLKKTNDAMALLRDEIAEINHKFYQAKIWLDINIFQPDHMGDALNYVDTFADAIQNAIEINDRWYAIKNLNWQIDKANPRLVLRILQNAKEHHAICQFCGTEKPFSAFNEATQKRLNAQIENGGGRSGQKICLNCKAIKIPRVKTVKITK